MAKRVLLAGILGGIAMFVWNFVAHDLLPLGEIGLREIPNEAAVLATMHANMPEPGLYIFPGFGLPADATRAQKEAAMPEVQRKAASGPQGVIVYHPIGNSQFMRQLLTEGGTNILQALIAVFLLAQVRLKRFSSRVGFVTLIGIGAAITTNISYWNWYGFPGNYTAGYVFTLVVGYIVVGVIAAAIVKSKEGKAVGEGA
ncbi:MAG TPA: hypothetical protein VHA33_28250 [Candidatus Angelobacter sp.]|jgi:hypothetical protein|nr:hypothetical protein [Candidatus Angelobacter sp.]